MQCFSWIELLIVNIKRFVKTTDCIRLCEHYNCLLIFFWKFSYFTVVSNLNFNKSFSGHNSKSPNYFAKLSKISCLFKHSFRSTERTSYIKRSFWKCFDAYTLYRLYVLFFSFWVIDINVIQGKASYHRDDMHITNVQTHVRSWAITTYSYYI